jgi:hypothetical protein
MRQRKNYLAVGEEDIKSILKPYKLQDALLTLGHHSIHLFHELKDRVEDGVIVTQHGLAYLANLFLISRAADYKDVLLSNNQANVPTLCDIYNNLPVPEMLDGKPLDLQGVEAIMFRGGHEQFRLQAPIGYLIARTLAMFLDNPSPVAAELDKVFCDAVGLSLLEYLKLGFIVYVSMLKKPWFTAEELTTRFSAERAPTLKVEVSEGTVNSFLKQLKTDYEGFKNLDIRRNPDYDPKFTKTRFNPLSRFPIIACDLQNVGPGFIVPNIKEYLLVVFGGLYWWFHDYYESIGEDPLGSFRTPFGNVFEEYVGMVLKDIYGEESIQGQIPYEKEGESKSIDWYKEEGNKVYLFEAKANQFRLQSRQKGYRQQLIEYESPKIKYAVNQMFNRKKDIYTCKELARFRDKEVIPIVVFLDMPFISNPGLAVWAKDAQMELAKEKGNPELEEFKVHFLNIQDLECFDAAVDKVAIEEVFEQAEKQKVGFDTILRQILGRPKLTNRLLENKTKEFLGSIND